MNKDQIKQQEEILEKLVFEFLWEREFQDSGISHGESAEIIFSTLKTHLPISEKTISIPLPDPKDIIQEHEKFWDECCNNKNNL